VISGDRRERRPVEAGRERRPGRCRRPARTGAARRRPGPRSRAG
jgi:hypothetical protein